MTRDVSLCVIRVERRRKKNEDNKEEIASSSLAFQGQRSSRQICIETYVAKEGCRPPLVSEGLSMAEEDEGAVGPLMVTSQDPVNTASESSTRDAIHFVSGNPFVETTHGILHLFKEDELTNIERAAKRSQTVCIMSVPSTMTCSDLLSFIAACYENIKHVRIIRDGSPHQYMALITFRSSKAVVEFYRSFNGIPFNSLEPEWCCHLVFVSTVETVGENEGGSIAPLSHTELPICPVCLERMDESVDGILTILCNHAFHGNCLAKWGDTSCPVCRYVQSPEPDAENFCLECLSSESLWICLICGHVGCGRYVQGHAYQHYKETNHCYSMQLGSNSVWDYVGDNFVHRILQNKTDGKLVEGPNPEKPNEANVKVDLIQLEFTNLLTSQLESQRMYYEEMISNLKDAFQKTETENIRLSETIKTANRDKIGLEKKVHALTNRLHSTQEKLSEEKELNEALQKNQNIWKKKYGDLEEEFMKCREEKSKELAEVKEQLRDVMFYLEAQNVITQRPDSEEIQSGRIEIAETSNISPNNRITRTRRRRNKQN